MLLLYDGLMFKGDRVMVPIPHVLRPEILDRVHAAHLGIEKCKARVRGSVFWPGMNNAIDEIVPQCRTCLQYQRRNQREPLIPYRRKFPRGRGQPLQLTYSII